MSVRWRLTIWIAVVLVLTFAAMFVVLRFAIQEILTSDLDQELVGDQEQIAAEIGVAGSLTPADLLILQRPSRYAQVVQPASFIAVIRDPAGKVLAVTPGVQSEDLDLTAGELSQVLGGTVLQRSAQIGGEDNRIRTALLIVDEKVVGIVQVGESAEHLHRVLEVLQIGLLSAAAAAILGALGGSYWLARRALKPIDDVAAVAEEIQASDLGRRIEARGKPAEVQRLADTFDAMLERLGFAFQQQRTFVLDVSHELRTPLTALRGNLDVLLMDARLDADTRLQLERMTTEVGRLIRLTSNLLYLAQADVGRELDRRPVEMDTLCLEVFQQLKDLRPEVKFRLGHEDQVTVQGDRDLLKQLILNLVDNALKYTPAGRQVVLSLYRDESLARLVVEDTGPGIPAERLALIFERFYRGADNHGSGGAGIGLAIGRWIARAHGGDIQVESQPGRGSVFTVLLPLESAEAIPAREAAGPEVLNRRHRS